MSGFEERVLHFEWHASHFRSVDGFLPPLPLNSNLMYGMAEDEFHTATIRFAILRKFIMGGEPVRLASIFHGVGEPAGSASLPMFAG